MNRHKYVHKREGFILFPDTFNHSDFGSKNNIISAGFCQIDTELEECFCFGESLSVGIKSLPSDSKDMTKQFFND